MKLINLIRWCEIDNDQDAREVITIVGRYLIKSANDKMAEEGDELVTADLARVFCDSLLKDTRADGMCGCRLCRS